MSDLTREAKLDLLIAKEEIREVLARYSRGVDRHDTEIILDVYHPDGTDTHSNGLARSPEELAEWGNSEHEKWWTSHSHMLTTTTIEVNGDRAASETYVMWVQKRRDAPRVDIGGGRYLDRLERREGEWRIAERNIVVDWIIEAESEDRRDVMSRYPKGTWDRTDPSYALFDEIRGAALAG